MNEHMKNTPSTTPKPLWRADSAPQIPINRPQSESGQLTTDSLRARHGDRKGGTHDHRSSSVAQTAREGASLRCDPGTQAHENPRASDADPRGFGISFEDTDRRVDRFRERANSDLPQSDANHRIGTRYRCGEADDPFAVSRLLTTQEVATHLRVHRNTVDAQRKAGRLAYTRIGNRVLFTEGQVMDYIQRQQTQAQEKPTKKQARKPLWT